MNLMIQGKTGMDNGPANPINFQNQNVMNNHNQTHSSAQKNPSNHFGSTKVKPR